MANDPEPAVRIEDLQQFIQSLSEISPVNLKGRDVEAEQTIKERETERLGRAAYFGLREKWSLYLCIFLAVMIASQIVSTALIGFGLFSFNDNKTFLYLVVGENFLQIVGMCYIVVAFLFPANTS